MPCEHTAGYSISNDAHMMSMQAWFTKQATAFKLLIRCLHHSVGACSALKAASRPAGGQDSDALLTMKVLGAATFALCRSVSW